MPTVCESLLDSLADVSVSKIFGITGDALNSLVDGIRRDERFEWITVRHEESAAFAAAAMAKLTGDLAVCAGTVGPGALHLINGLYDAKRDYAPVLAITGQVAGFEYGSQYFQEVNLESVFADVAGFNQTVRSVDQFQRLAQQAIQYAIEKRCVAHLSIPVDIIGMSLPKTNFHRKLGKFKTTPLQPQGDQLRGAAEAINRASKPVILAGDGCRGARQELLDLAGKIQAPIVHSLRGTDVVEYEHELWVGGIGHLGTPQGISALDGCDFLLMAGCDFPYHAFLPSGIPIAQIDIRAENIGRRCAVTQPLLGSVKPTLSALLPIVEKATDSPFLKVMQQKRSRWDRKMDKKSSLRRSENLLHPQTIVRYISDTADKDAVYVIDVGTATVWAGRHLRLRGTQRMLGSFNHGSLGVGLPAAIGVQAANPNRQVIAICGDGGFAMLMADFITAVRYDFPIVVVVLNNAKFGFVELEMQASGYVRHGTDLTNPDFVDFANSCGGLGLKLDNPEKIEEIFGEAFSARKPVLIDAHVNPDELFAPAKIQVSVAVNYTLGRIKELFIPADEDIGNE